jgi:hypothetical protein
VSFVCSVILDHDPHHIRTLVPRERAASPPLKLRPLFHRQAHSWIWTGRLLGLLRIATSKNTRPPTTSGERQLPWSLNPGW